MGDALIHPKPWRCRLGRHKWPDDPNKTLRWHASDNGPWVTVQASCERCFKLMQIEVMP